MNIYDIAQEAEVSIATISRAINSPEKLKKETLERVEAVLAKYGYQPNAAARSLVTQNMYTIGVLTVDTRVIHYAKTAYVLEQELSKNGYNVMLCNTGGLMEENLRYLKMLREKRVDGLVLIGSIFERLAGNQEAMNFLADIPVVICNGKLPMSNVYSVIVDDSLGTFLAAQHLISRGCKSIYYVQDMDTGSALRKVEGFKQAVTSSQMSLEGRILQTSFGLEGGRKVAEKLLEGDASFDGIVFGEDLTAVGAMKALIEAGMKIPDDVAVTGFDNSIYAEISTPTLSSIDNKYSLVGECAVKILKLLLEKSDDAVDINIRPVFVKRESA